MQKIFFLLVGLFIGATSLLGQNREADQKVLFENMPVVHKMSREDVVKRSGSTTYKFIKGDARYERTYVYGGAQKLCFHDFVIERDGKRYCLSYFSSSDPKFYTETYSENKKEWVESEKTKCQLSDLPYNIRHTIRIDQGTLSVYR